MIRPGKQPLQLPVPGPRLPLGVREQVAYASRKTGITKDECLLLLTDGLPEARDHSGDPLGYRALEELLAGTRSTASAQERLVGLFEAVQMRTGRAPEDDWTAAILVPQPDTAEP